MDGWKFGEDLSIKNWKYINSDNENVKQKDPAQPDLIVFYKLLQSKKKEKLQHL